MSLAERMQKMKNIVCEACNEICQYVSYHKTNFPPIKGTDINPDCRLSYIFCSVACADNRSRSVPSSAYSITM